MNIAEGLPQLEGRIVNGRFRLLRWLGGSRVSEVFLATIEGDTTRMASFKLMAATVPDAEARLAGWVATSQFSHQNLIGVIDCGRCEIDGCPFVYQVTEYADEVLAEILPARPLTADEAREMLGPVLDALEYLHARDYVHGRLKPSNVLVVNDLLKLSADSMTMVAGNSSPRAETGVYDAPELARGAVTSAVDVWALGMTLVAAMTQKPAPWERWIQAEPAIPAELAEPFGRIAKACLRVDPAERCTLNQIRGILDPALERKPVLPIAARKGEKTDSLEQTKRAGSWRAPLIAAVAAAVVASTALMVRNSEFPATRPTVREQPKATSDSAAKQAPQSAILKPSPSGRSRQIAPVTTAGAGAASVPRDAESKGVLLRVNPEILPAAKQSIRGQVNVSVRVNVDSAGKVTNAELELPSQSNYFNRVSVDAARQWRFAAGTGGTWHVHFQFRHDGTDLSATRE